MGRTEVAARAAARKKAEAALAESARRLRENQDALAAFFASSEEVAGIDSETARAVAALEAKAERRKSALRSAQGRSLSVLRGNGENVASLASLAGLSQREARELLDAARATDAPAAGAGSGEGVGDGASSASGDRPA
ncbi:hypothetical protein [Lolliginicoccus levis]|uniref:hypothetical protein n=1 Tax=Lolliginicoccus levis TaxID=2919542 RepID=UPI00241CD6A9|nr:hypothetical protein [Lolliginicoccus levis]